jgi:hypothetical protein
LILGRVLRGDIGSSRVPEQVEAVETEVFAQHVYVFDQTVAR